MARALGIQELYNKSYKIIDLPQKWKDHIGMLEDNFKAIIWGESGHGKTNYLVMLIKELAKLGYLIDFISYEEVHGYSIQRTFTRHDMIEVKGKIRIIEPLSFEELMIRLKRKKSAKVVVFDSLQYSRITFDQYKELKQTFKKKILIFNSHADGKKPSGKVADDIRYDVGVKIYVNEFRAFPRSRYGGNQPFTIWDKKPVTGDQLKLIPNLPAGNAGEQKEAV
jgi:hypothetical protein